MNTDILDNWAGALLIITVLLGIIALAWIGLCVINQKHDRYNDLGSDHNESDN